jgi:hypothetical protein
MENPTPTMRVVSFYHRETGLFSGRHLMVSDPALIPLNTPQDHIAIEGDHYDPLTQRVDVTTGKVVDHLPPKPSDTTSGAAPPDVGSYVRRLRHGKRRAPMLWLVSLSSNSKRCVHCASMHSASPAHMSGCYRSIRKSRSCAMC